MAHLVNEVHLSGAAWDPTLQTEDSDESCWSPLQLASREGRLEDMRNIIEVNPSSVNEPPRGYYGQTALQAACMQGHEDCVQMLLEAGADVHVCDSNNFQRDALQIACGLGNIRIVESLLRAGAAVNVTADTFPNAKTRRNSSTASSTIVTRYNGRTALQAASERGHIHLVRLLLDLGADINAPPSSTGGCTAIQAAAAGGFAPVVKILLSEGANVNGPTAKTKGFTALQGACLGGSLEVVDMLIEAGADVHAEGGKWRDGTALHAAAQKGQIEIIKHLLDAGADVNRLSGTRGRGQTALQSAAIGGHDDTVRLLRERGALGGTAGGKFLFL